MLRNIKVSLIAHIGVSIVIAYMGGFGQSFYMQIIFTLVAMFMYFTFGNAFADQGSKLKNLASVSIVSIICLVLAIVCIAVFQVDVVNKYNYAMETVRYKIIHFITFYFNASTVPLAGLVGDFASPWRLPYGLVFTFFLPSLFMWLGIERSAKKKSKMKKI